MKFFLLILIFNSFLIYADDFLKSLSEFRSSQSAKGLPSPNIQSKTTLTSAIANECTEDDQTSVPLSYLSSILLDPTENLKVTFDAAKSTISLSSSAMISNCSNMLKWTLRTVENSEKNSYAIEVKFKKNKSCNKDGCIYEVAKVDGKNARFFQKRYPPNLSGFESCLKDSVFREGSIKSSLVFSAPLSVKMSVPKKSGELLFVSRGPSSPLIGAKHGAFTRIEGCDYFEKIDPAIDSLLTLEDQSKKELEKKAEELKNCQNYGTLIDFIKENESFAGELENIALELIKNSALKSAEAIRAGNYTDEDLKVINDFNQYVVSPKIELAKKLYQEINISRDEGLKKQKQLELNKVLADISGYGKPPYFESNHINTLIKDGKFNEAEKLNSLRSQIVNHQRLGSKEKNVVITPEVASSRISYEESLFSEKISKEQELYEYKTGQSSGKYQEYTDLVKTMTHNIQHRTQSYREEIALEMQKIESPRGYCFRYFRNTPRCIRESVERIQELQMRLQQYNTIDRERAKEYAAEAKKWGELEEQGRRYIATKYGEEPPLERRAEILTPQVGGELEDSTEEDDSQVFEYKTPYRERRNPFSQRGQMTPRQYTYPVYPQGNNFFNQSNFPQNQDSYQFNWNGGYGAQYGHTPFSAYNYQFLN